MIGGYTDVFARSTCNVLVQMGIDATAVGKPFVPELTRSNHEVVIIIGLAQDIKGSVIFSMAEDTAKAIASTMMCGMPIDGLDVIAQSAVCEFANMSSGSSVCALAPAITADITPPTLIMGQRISVLASPKEVMAATIDTTHGTVEIAIGLA